jgi:hypothetical protein
MTAMMTPNSSLPAVERTNGTGVSRVRQRCCCSSSSYVDEARAEERALVAPSARGTQMDKVREGQLGWAWGRLSDGDDMEYRGWYGRCTGGV